MTNSSINFFRTFCDDEAVEPGSVGVARMMHRWDVGEVANNTGAIDMASQPNAAELRDQCLRTSIGGNASARADLLLRFTYSKAHGLGISQQIAQGSTGGVFPLNRGFIRYRSHFTDPGIAAEVRVFSIADDAAGRSRVILDMPGDGTFAFRVEWFQTGLGWTSAGTSRALNLGEMLEWAIGWDVASNTISLTTKALGETAWTEETLSTPAGYVLTPIHSYRFGATQPNWTSAETFAAYWDCIQVSDRSFSQVIKGPYYLSGSTTADADQTRGMVRVIYRPGLFRNATQARVVWADNAEFSGATTTDWQALSGAVHASLPVLLSGLPSRSWIWYRIDIGDAGGSVIYSDPGYTFCTFPDVGVEVPHTMGFTSCSFQGAAGHPYEGFADALARMPKPGDVVLYLFTQCNGDQSYETFQLDLSRQENPDLLNVYTAPGFRMRRYEALDDAYMIQVLRRGVYKVLPDDHEVKDNVERPYLPGGAEENVLLPELRTGFIGTGFPADVTIGTVMADGLSVAEAWEQNLRLDLQGYTPGSYQFYGHHIFGRTHYVMMDGRYERITGGPAFTVAEFVSATQLQYLKDRVTAFAAAPDANLLILNSNGAHAARPAKTVEGWAQVAPAQFEEFYDFMHATLPSDGSKRVLITTGDDHIGYNFCRDLGTTANPVPDPIGTETLPIVGQVLFACNAQAAHDSSNGVDLSTSVWSLPSPDNRIIRVPIGLLEFAPDNSWGRALAFRENGDNYEYPNFDDPRMRSVVERVEFTMWGAPQVLQVGDWAVPSWTRRCALTVPQAGVPGSGALTGAALRLTRQQLPDEVCDPSSGSAAQIDGGDLRFSSDQHGVNQIPCEIVRFEHDSATGAADAIVDIFFKADVSGAADTTLYLWWNASLVVRQPLRQAAEGSEAVWSDYVAVWHMTPTVDDPAPTIAIDSSPAGRNLAPAITAPSRGNGIAASTGGLSFDGVGDLLRAKGGAVTGANDRTFMAMINMTSAAGDRVIAALGGDWDSSFDDNVWTLAMVSGTLRLITRNSGAVSTFVLDDGGDHFIAVRQAGGTLSDATLIFDQDSFTPPSNVNAVDTRGDVTLFIGGGHRASTTIADPGGFFDGEMAEVRFASVALSDDEIELARLSMVSPATLVTTGAARAVTGTLIGGTAMAFDGLSDGAVIIAHQISQATFEADT